MARLNHSNLGIWINTYNRPDALNKNIRSLRESLGDSYEINVISNHSSCKFFEDYGNVNVHYNNLRPDESWGYLSRNWNQCIYMGLSKHEHVLITQDDMCFKKGWLDLINNNKSYIFYSAPIGDLAHLTSRDAFLNVGWWDETFVGIDYQDYDYLNRVYHSIKDLSSVVDHGLGWRWNDIGLDKYWIGEGFKGDKDRPRGHEKAHNRMNRQRYARKRGMPSDVIMDPLCHKNKRWRDISVKPSDDEIDWYPWFTSKMQIEKQRKREFGKPTPYFEHYKHDGY